MRFPGGSAFLELLSRDFSKKSQHTLNRGHRLAPRAWHVVTSKHEKADTKGKKRKKQQLTEWKQGEQHLSVPSFGAQKHTNYESVLNSCWTLCTSTKPESCTTWHPTHTCAPCDLCRAPNIRGSLLWSAASAGWIITLCCTWLHLESREDFDKLDVCWEVAEDAASQRGKINTNWWCSG